MGWFGSMGLGRVYCWLRLGLRCGVGLRLDHGWDKFRVSVGWVWGGFRMAWCWFRIGLVCLI